MLKHNQLTYSHITACRRTIIFKHIDNRLPQQRQIVFTEACHLACQISRNIAINAIQSIRHDILASHLGALIFCILFRRNCHSGNRNLLRHNRINAASKTKLHRTANLTTVQRRFHKSCHNCTKSTDIKEIFAHKLANFLVYFRIVFFQLFDFLFICTPSNIGCIIAIIQRNAVLDINLIAFFILAQRLDTISDLALQAHIRNNTITGFRINTRHIACIRIAIRIAVFYIK